jgi:hypothetical protein
MSKAPAFQFYAGDRAMELMGLDNEAVGAWTRAMMYLWTAGPAPEERLVQVAGKGWERVWFLFGSFSGGLGLDWMEEVREKQRVFRENAAKNGSKGGRPSKGKKGTLTEPKPKPNPKQRVGSMKIEVETQSSGKERAHELELVTGPSFSDFWGLYGKKVGKPAAEREWQKLTTKDHEAVMRSVPAYVRAKEKIYRKDPERFLKHRAWEDEVITTNNAPRNGKQPRPTETELLLADIQAGKYDSPGEDQLPWPAGTTAHGAPQGAGDADLFERP